MGCGVTMLILNELRMDLRKMFSGWRLGVLLVLLGIVFFMIRMGEEAEIGYMVMMYSILVTAFTRIRLYKLLYLLPISRQDRIKYILLKCLGLFLYNLLLYLIILFSVTLLSDYRFSRELPTLLCIVLPMLITYCSLTMGSGYHMGKSQDEELTGKYKRQYTVSSLMAFPVLFISCMFNITFFWELLQGTAIIIITTISYCFAFACLHSQITALKHTELSEENVSRAEKLFE